MQKKSPLSTLLPTYIAAYAVWVAFFVAGFWFFIPQIRILLLDLAHITSANRWLLSAIDRYATLLLGVLWLVIVIYVEHYLRTSVPKARLMARIRRLVLWSVGLAVFLMAGQWLIEIAARSP